MRRAGPARPERPPEISGGRRRLLLGIGAALLIVCVLGGGWFAALVFQSPAQLAAGAKPPPPGAITAPVTRGDLTRTVSIRPKVGRERNDAVAIALADGPGHSVVTKSTASVGAELTDGAVAIEVNGRPRFALRGAFPFYRPMTEGDVGPDVEQLQRALAAAGYAVGADGKFGKGTAQALSRLYRDAGYEPNHGSADSSPGKGKAGPDPGIVGTASSVIVPESEFLVFASLPAFVTSIPPTGARLAETAAVGVAAGRVVADAAVDAATAGQLSRGMKAVLNGPTGEPIHGSVIDVMAPSVDAPQASDGASSSGSPGPEQAPDSAGAASWTVRIGMDADPPGTWMGTEVRGEVTLDLASSNTLLVPSVAVISAGHGASYVLKRMHDGTFLRVAVREAAQLAGTSAIEPRKAGELRDGDHVKVG
jgi:peptidoglycan hydrolase-like protein with peptidoglycan-binding domain